jgi:HD-GYP domain-containing protein (c-di-GMP phosphodiesterase class II)
LAIADAFDAMMSDRLYRTRLSMDEAKARLSEGAGTQFDAEIIKVFLDLLEEPEKIFGGDTNQAL